MSFGCSQRLPKTPAEVQKQVINWEINTVNPLLTYVPADAPVVLATQRTHSYDSKALTALKERFKLLWDYYLFDIYDESQNRINYMLYTYANVDDSDFDDESGNDEQLFTSQESYEKQQKIEEQKQINKRRKDIKTQYENWKNDCNPFSETDIKRIDFAKTYAKTSDILADDTCSETNSNTCACRLKAIQKSVESVENIYKDHYSTDFNNLFNKLEYFKIEYERYNALFNNNIEIGLKFSLFQNRDSVLYIKDSHLVAHMSVLDENKALPEIIKLLMSNDNKLFDVDTSNIIRTEIKVDGKNWILFSSNTEEDALKLAIHAENNVITFTLYVNEFPKNVLQIQDNAFKPSSFESMPPNTITAMHVNLMNLGKLFDAGTLSFEFDKELKDEIDYIDCDGEVCGSDIKRISISDDVCRREIGDFFSDSPKLNAYLSADENGALSFHFYQKLNKEKTAQIKDLIPPHPLCGNIDDDIRMEIAFNPVLFIDNLNKFVQSKSKNNYQCPAVKVLIHSLKNKFKDLDKEDDEIYQFLIKLRALSIIVHRISSINHFARLEFDDTNNFFLLPMLKEQFNLNLTEGVASDIDISRKLGATQIMLKGNTLFEGSNIDEHSTICRQPENGSTMLIASISKRFISFIVKEFDNDNLHLDELFPHNVQLYSKHEKDSFSIHLEEVD